MKLMQILIFKSFRPSGINIQMGKCVYGRFFRLNSKNQFNSAARMIPVLNIWLTHSCELAMPLLIDSVMIQLIIQPLSNSYNYNINLCNRLRHRCDIKSLATAIRYLLRCIAMAWLLMVWHSHLPV